MTCGRKSEGNLRKGAFLPEVIQTDQLWEKSFSCRNAHERSRTGAKGKMPLQTVNDLLVSRNYVLVVFNGIEVIAGLYGSDFLSEMYKAPAGEMSEKFALFNYNELRFNLDTFYSLKEEHGIKDFGDFFIATDLMADLADTDSKAFDRALLKLTLKYFDDGHSRLVTNSWLSGQPDADEAQKSIMDDLGLSTNELVSEGTRLKSLRAGFYPDHPEIDPEKDNEKPWFYEEVGDTAVVTFDSFFVSKLDYYKEADPEHADDTIELISYAHSQITRAGSPVKNVVVDLSCNNGGMTDAAVFLMSWLQSDGESIVAMKSTLTGAQSVGSYLADINLDGNFDEKDKLLYPVARADLICNAVVLVIYADIDVDHL